MIAQIFTPKKPVRNERLQYYTLSSTTFKNILVTPTYKIYKNDLSNNELRGTPGTGDFFQLMAKNSLY
jgi:hypothetical protein